MRKFAGLTILIIFSGLAACGGGSGTTSSGNDSNNFTEYYVSASTGSDSNNGLSRTTAWKTLNKVSSFNFTTTAKIFLNRGDIWNESLTLANSNIIIDAYGVGAEPLLDGSEAQTILIYQGSGIYSVDMTLAAGEGLGNVSQNGNVLNFLPWQTNVATTFAGSSANSFSYDYSNSRVYIKPAVLTNPYSISKNFSAIKAENVADIVIKNINIQNYSLHGIDFLNCVRCTAENVTIKNIGGAVIAANTTAPPDYIYAGNGIEYANGSTNGTVSNANITDIFDSCLTTQTFASNQIVSNIRFQNNSLSQCGFAGVELSVLSNGGSTGSSISNITLAGLTISNSGKGWSGRRYGTEGHGLRIIADNSAGTMSNIKVDTSIVSNSAGDGIKLAGEINTVELKRIRSTRNSGKGINVAAPSASTLRLDLSSSIIDQNKDYGVSYNAPAAAGFKLYQNTFYNNAVINMAVFSQAGIADIRNNIFYSSAAMTHLFSLAALASPVIDNNCYNDTVNMFGYSGSTYSTVNTFNSATGFETNGIGNIPVALSNPTADIFTLTSTSSCRSRGVAGTGITTDYLNNNFLNPPSSGAYEYIP